MEIKAAEYLTQEKTVQAGGLRVVAIGGGTGLSTLLKGLKKFVPSPAETTTKLAPLSIRDLCAVVTVSQ